jgi:putative transposase
MTRPARYFHPGQLQFITSSTYRRAQLFESERFRQVFAEVLGTLRQEMGFRLIGWVLMPEHFHLLLKPEPAEATSRILQELKKRTALRILTTLREQRQHGWCRKMLVRLRLPPTVHDESRYRVWQRRFYPFNVYSDKKRLEKLRYMHGNPVQRGLVSSPDQWPWSSFRFYYLNDASVLAMDQLG